MHAISALGQPLAYTPETAPQRAARPAAPGAWAPDSRSRARPHIPVCENATSASPKQVKRGIAAHGNKTEGQKGAGKVRAARTGGRGALRR